MKRTFFSLLAVMVIGAGCAEADRSKPETTPREAAAASYVEAERVPAEAAPEPDRRPAAGLQKFRDGYVRVNGKAIEVTDASGKIIAANRSLVLTADEGGDCSSNGFGRVVVSGDFFTIEQQACGGMFFVDEYITFKAGRDGKVWLHKFSIVKSDREDPEKTIPQRNLSTEDFGRIELKDVETQKLYELF